ncbi:MAG: PEP-CTERM sorting domain-containing protein [Planctomycetia bacterium]|nr:PEP-CTERM sorting domain-containing protein [Planctomycetia bacterium]
MKWKLAVAAIALSAMATSAQASKLVVMGINLNGAAPAGQKIYTIGMDTEGAAGSLALGNLIFVGTGLGGNPLQSNFNGAPVFPFPEDNPDSKQDAFTLGNLGEPEFTQYDSWFYAGSSGQLINAKGKVVTTDPIVGPSGRLWFPQATGIQGGQGTAPEFGSGTDFSITATYGTFPTFVAAGIYPVAQLRVSGNVSIGFAAGSKLSVQPNGGQEVATNVLGGPQNVDPLAFLDFTTNTIHGIPEPSTLALAGLGLAGLIGLAWRRRK